MQLSPSVELVWAMAAGEAIATKKKEIEPEHFFCALLKFSEMGDGELQAATPNPLVAIMLSSERDKVRSVLEKRSLPSTRIRQQLRQAIGAGAYQHNKDETIHRSDASRRVFERAAQIAQQASASLVDACHLLEALLANPTPTLAKVLKESGAGVNILQPQPGGEPRLLERWAQDMVQAGGDAAVPEAAMPQVRVLAQAVQGTDRTPILLICAPRVRVQPIVLCTAQQVHPQPRIARVDHATMLQELRDPGVFTARMVDLFAEAAGIEDLALFLDATRQSQTTIAPLLAVFKTGSPGNRPRLLLAVSADVYENAIETDSDLDGVFRLIWLHELTGGGLPREL